MKGETTPAMIIAVVHTAGSSLPGWMAGAADPLMEGRSA